MYNFIIAGHIIVSARLSMYFRVRKRKISTYCSEYLYYCLNSMWLTPPLSLSVLYITHFPYLSPSSSLLCLSWLFPIAFSLLSFSLALSYHSPLLSLSSLILPCSLSHSLSHSPLHSLSLSLSLFDDGGFLFFLSCELSGFASVI